MKLIGDSRVIPLCLPNLCICWAVKGLTRSEKSMRSSVGSLLIASLAARSAVSILSLVVDGDQNTD